MRPRLVTSISAQGASRFPNYNATNVASAADDKRRERRMSQGKMA